MKMIQNNVCWLMLVIVGGVDSCVDPGQPTSISVENFHSSNSLSVSWSAPLGLVDFYYVFLTGDVNYMLKAYSEYYYVSELLPGREYNIAVQAVQGSCTSTAPTVTEATYPSSPGLLTYSNIGVNVITLKWSDPENMGDVSKQFNITIMNGYKVLLSTIKDTPEITYTNVPYGYYTISITTVGVRQYTSWPVNQYVFMPNHLSTSAPGISTPTTHVNAALFIVVQNNQYTNQLSVTWTAPSGNVDYYVVYITGDVSYQKETTFTSVILPNLLPGREYTVYVETVSGVNRVKSALVKEATYPTQPGLLISKDIGTNYVLLKWNDPVDMSSVSKHFNIILRNTEVLQSTKVDAPSIRYSNLPKGYYTVNITTVGAREYTSWAVTESFYMPYDLTTTSGGASGGDSVGAIAGGVIGGIVALGCLGFAIFWIVRCIKNKRKTPETANPPTSPGMKPEIVEPQYDTIIDHKEQNQKSWFFKANKQKPKNQKDLAIPQNDTRVKPSKPFLNASYVPGQSSAIEFIAIEDPVPGTLNAFWTMIWENRINTIVMLSEDNEVQSEGYMPLGRSGTYGPVLVESPPVHGPPQKDSFYWKVRRLIVTNVKEQGRLQVQHFQYGSLDQYGDRDNREIFIQFTKLVHQYRYDDSPGHPILVHCRNGVEKSGLFIALSRIITQLQQSEPADVPGLVSDLQRHHPSMIKTEAQYSYLSKCSLELVNSNNSIEYSGVEEEIIYETHIGNDSVRA